MTLFLASGIFGWADLTYSRVLAPTTRTFLWHFCGLLRSLIIQVSLIWYRHKQSNEYYTGHLIYWIHLYCLVLNIRILHGVPLHSQILQDAVFHEHRLFFAIREQSGGIIFLPPLSLRVTFHQLFITIFCILVN